MRRRLREGIGEALGRVGRDGLGRVKGDESC